MMRVLGMDVSDARRLLGSVGTEVHDRADLEVTLATVLPEGERGDRAEVELLPPPAGQEDLGMGAWHVNRADEAHSVLSGRGVMEFRCGEVVVPVLVEPGDVVVVRGGEHRYRPVTPQRWVIRHSGGPDADLGTRETGRPGGGWSTPD